MNCTVPLAHISKIQTQILKTQKKHKNTSRFLKKRHQIQYICYYFLHKLKKKIFALRHV